MVTIRRAIIVSKVDNKYRVRVPLYHGIEGSANYVVDKDLPLATVSAITMIQDQFVKGDKVFVIFEDNDKNKPIIIGLLNNEDTKRSPIDTTILNKIIIKGEAQLPKSTIIGEVTDSQIQHLKHVRADVQRQIDVLVDKIKEKSYYYNIEVTTDLWVADTTYTTYPFRAQIDLDGMLITMRPAVAFHPDEDLSNFSTVCESGDGFVYIYAKTMPTTNVMILEIIGEPK